MQYRSFGFNCLSEDETLLLDMRLFHHWPLYSDCHRSASEGAVPMLCFNCCRCFDVREAIEVFSLSETNRWNVLACRLFLSDSSVVYACKECLQRLIILFRCYWYSIHLYLYITATLEVGCISGICFDDVYSAFTLLSTWMTSRVRFAVNFSSLNDKLFFFPS